MKGDKEKQFWHMRFRKGLWARVPGKPQNEADAYAEAARILGKAQMKHVELRKLAPWSVHDPERGRMPDAV